MVLWWIGNVILLVVMLPVVIFLLNRVLAAVERIRHATDDILTGGVALGGELHRGPGELAAPPPNPQGVPVATGPKPGPPSHPPAQTRRRAPAPPHPRV